MSWFPQIGLGAIAQFPLTRTQIWRAITNDLESSEEIMLPDTPAAQVGWQLSFQDLTDEEAMNLSALFTASQGSYSAFTFIDPLANLFGWSEDFTQPNWQVGLLQTAAGVADPLGTQRASSISNTSPGTQAVQQSLGIPGAYVACFSLWLRSATAGTVILQRDNIQAAVAVGSAWTRQFVTGLGVSGATQSVFSITLAAGQTIDVFGLQAEAQPWPSAYKQTSSPLGIYGETYFGSDDLTVTSTSVGLSSCKVRLISRVG